ncbi:MAG: DNA polymerase III subunit gamma/tau [Paenibacillaceae bacterium ZCTH02-B3]|nr:MAG: DNA polymerase III subunit gamma/tau [Paenibacillaceae bacterium ZCTH02-B3]
MGHIALYRTWRPQAFRDMVGQQHIVQTLQNAIREERLSHAYLFSGPRGTGKTSAAKILAKAINCERGPAPEPCNECPACRGITAGTVMDVVEIDAASNRGIDEIREIRDKVRYAPTEVRRKVYIIDEVHMLTAEAFNALLKTLEEPPRHALFVLATTEPHRVPATIVSRCQRFEFRRVSAAEQAARMREICRHEGIEAEDEALEYIARLSDGGMRDALSLLDQIASFTGGKVTLRDAVEITGGLQDEQFARLAAAVRDGDAGAALREAEALMRAGKNPERCLELIMRDFRDLLLVRLAPGAVSPEGGDTGTGRLGELAGAFPVERLFFIIETLNRYLVDMKYAAHPQTMFELALLKLCAETGRPADGEQAVSGAPPGTGAGAGADGGGSAAELAELRRRVAELESRVESLMRGAGQAGPAAAESADGKAGDAAGTEAGGQAAGSTAEEVALPGGLPAGGRAADREAVSGKSSRPPDQGAGAAYGAPSPVSGQDTGDKPLPRGSGQAAGDPTPSRAPGPDAGARTPLRAPGQDAGGRTPSGPLRPPGAKVRLQPFLAAADSPETKQVIAQWPDVLQEVKKTSISLQAWLKNGEPVAFADGTVLVAFLTPIHRETTEKPANRQAIEDAVAAVLGREVRLATVMRKEWQEALAAANAAPSSGGREELKLVPEDESGDPPWVEEAVRLFGGSLVVVEDE